MSQHTTFCTMRMTTTTTGCFNLLKTRKLAVIISFKYKTLELLFKNLWFRIDKNLCYL